LSSQLLKIWTIAYTLTLLVANAYSQELRKRLPSIPESEVLVLRKVPNWDFTTKAYREEALRLMLAEANRVAGELPLGERLPITKSDLVEAYVAPPALLILGWVSTSNYIYNVDRKFCALARRDMVRRFYEEKAKYSWPLSRLDTNKAFQMATQLMTAVSFDVGGLSRDCTLEITLPETQGFIKRHFFPQYWVIWRKSGETVAYIEFVEPTKTILQLDVRDAKYNRRELLRIPNLGILLDETNASTKP
jgi:hypothetical protein